LAEKIYQKEIYSDPTLIPSLDDFITSIAKEAGLDTEKFNNLSLSFSEAVSNSMTHGNCLDPTKKVTITVKVNESKMVIIIKDEGKGFNIHDVPDCTKPENILKDSGRGIHIMKSFLDNLTFNFTPEGTETILVLNLR